MTAIGRDAHRRAWRYAVLCACGAWALLCHAAVAQVVELVERPEFEFPLVFMDRPAADGIRIGPERGTGALHLVRAQPSVHNSGEPVANTGPPPSGQLPAESIVPHAVPQAGCGCPGCQSGQALTFPGYDQLGYALQGGCPPVVISEEWCRRPFFVDIFAGAVWGDDFIDGQIGQETSVLIGGRLGWDINGSWGVEGRLAFSEASIYNLNGPGFNREADLFLWDVSIVHYFGSNLRLRPYLSVGLGAVDWEYEDVVGAAQDEKFIGVPIGIGVKRRCDDWLVLRLDLTDNLAFGGGSDLGTQHNLSVTGNVEIRFGGPRTSYWAWWPRKHYSW